MAIESLVQEEPVVEGEEEVALCFVRPIPGAPFRHSRNYVLRSLGPQYGPYASLVSMDQPDLSFVVAAPGLLFPDYVYRLPEDEQGALRIEDAAEITTLAMVRRADVPGPVVNLRAPIVVNKRLKLAAQVLLDEDCGYGFMVPVDAPSAHFKDEPPC